MPDSFVWIVVAHFTAMSIGFDVLPEAAHRKAYAAEADCRRALPAVRRSFERRDLPIRPDVVTCEKLEIKR